MSTFKCISVYITLFCSIANGFGIQQLLGQQKNNPVPISTAKQELLNNLDDTQGFNDATQERTSLVSAMIDENPTPIQQLLGQQKNNPIPISAAKQALLKNLDDTHGFNDATQERTSLVSAMIDENPTPRPGSTKSFAPLAAGTWRIVYAPHISTMGKLFFGSFDPVYYILRDDGTMTSHARYQFPLIGSGWLSVSGTFSSQDEDQICRVDFEKAWIKLPSDIDESHDFQPFDDLDSVPSSLPKTIINFIGKLGFAEQFSVFPVSFLDNDTIVFDFKLLGTRICARKLDEQI
jgi:hypothetical protein